MPATTIACLGAAVFITLSALESECVSLSSSLHEMIPLEELLKESCDKFSFAKTVPSLTHSTVCEDDNGCLCLATAQAMTPRTKHIAVIHHWFHSHVGKTVFVKKVNTEEQITNVFSEPLNPEVFACFSESLCGW